MTKEVLFDYSLKYIFYIFFSQVYKQRKEQNKIMKKILTAIDISILNDIASKNSHCSK